jgi:hypothetical protein
MECIEEVYFAIEEKMQKGDCTIKCEHYPNASGILKECQKCCKMICDE